MIFIIQPLLVTSNFVWHAYWYHRKFRIIWRSICWTSRTSRTHIGCWCGAFRSHIIIIVIVGVAHEQCAYSFHYYSLLMYKFFRWLIKLSNVTRIRMHRRSEQPFVLLLQTYENTWDYAVSFSAFQLSLNYDDFWLWLCSIFFSLAFLCVCLLLYFSSIDFRFFLYNTAHCLWTLFLNCKPVPVYILAGELSNLLQRHILFKKHTT